MRPLSFRSLTTAAHLLVLLCVILVRSTVAQNDASGNFPIEFVLTNASRPSGIVAGRETNMYIATVGGRLFRIDIKSGAVTLINRGGDGQALSGLCTDERGAGTLYAGGRDSGRLYAFSRDGKLKQVYQITRPSTPTAPHFIADCITSRYKLLITDAYASSYYWLPLVDQGPKLGLPVPINPKYRLQGYEVKMRGAWTPPKLNTLGAFGIEWTGKWNETAYIMHSTSGVLYAFDIMSRASEGAVMVPVQVEGTVNAFPGALGILFDSTNELIMYIAMPTTNRIAVIEFDHRNKLRAKYIRSISTLLMNRPIMLGEYGDWIYPISGQFGKSASQRENSTYVIPRMSRHKQDISKTVNSKDPFSTLYDGLKDLPDGTPLPVAVIQDKIKTPPKKTGVLASTPLKTGSHTPVPTPTSTATPRPSSSPFPFGLSPVFGELAEKAVVPSKKACFPADAVVQLESGIRIRMSSIRIGDRVRVGTDADGNAMFSPVYMFSHRDAFVKSTFLQVTLSDQRMLRLSPGHYMHLNGRLVAAEKAAIGDVSDGATIVRIQQVSDVGLYNPQTIDGSIVVSDVRVSTYTTAVHPAVAVSALGPLRCAHRWRMRWLPQLVSTLLAEGSPRLVTKILSPGFYVY